MNLQNFPSRISNQFFAKEFVTLLFVSLGGSMLCFGYELFNFSFSIDEELAGFQHGEDYWRAWLGQGRWAMGLLVFLLPSEISYMPFVATALFCLATCLAAVICSGFFFKETSTRAVFCGLFVTSPIMPHLVQFNTFSHGVGLGYLLCAIGLWMVLKDRLYFYTLALIPFTLAIGIYQSFVFFLASAVLLMVFAKSEFNLRKRFLMVSIATFVVLASYAFSGLIVKISLRVFRINQSDYFSNYIHIKEVLPSLSRSLEVCWDILNGSRNIYLDMGFWVLLPIWIGLITLLINLVSRKNNNFLQSGFSFLLVLGAFSVSYSLVLASSGRIPLRALLGFTILFPLLAAFPMVFPKLRIAFLPIVVLSIFCSILISNLLFHKDRLARIRDHALAIALYSKFQNVEPTLGAAPVSFSVIGSPSFLREQNKQVEVFGASFFTHDGGNPYRAAAYMKSLGVSLLNPAPTAAVSNKQAILSRPTWPHPESVFKCDNTLVVKFEDIEMPVDSEITKKLWDSIVDQNLGAPGRDPKPSPNGVALAAGMQPTTVQFDVKGKFNALNVFVKSVFVPMDAPSNAGISGVEIFVDGKTQGRKIVDRQTKHAWSLNLENAKELKFVVDNANGTDFWDWVEMECSHSNEL
jgi:hypothetical protein